MTTLSESIETSITQVFSVLPDPRKLRNQQHLLLDILTIAIISVLSGCDDWLEITTYAKARESWFCQFLSLPNGVPSVDTFRRVFRFIDHRSFETCFVQWVERISFLTKGKIVSIDGKCLRGSRETSKNLHPICVVSAFAAENSIVLGQVATEAKSNEITAIPLLLDMLDIKDAIVTIDAAGCQKGICQKILEKGGDYVLGLKGNQQTLYDEAQNFFQQALAADFAYLEFDHFHTEERSRNRQEVRDVYVVDNLDWLDIKSDWPGLHSLTLVRSQRTLDNKISIEDRYYISSLSANAEELGRSIRSHWSVENKLHWVLDVAYKEDLCKTRKDNGAQNFGMLRRMTINLIRLHKERNPKIKGGIKCRRKCASWSDTYLQELLECK